MMRLFNRRTVLAIAAASLAAAASCPAAAQDYPKKTTIRIIVPQAVGSATDTVARLLAQRIAANLGQQMIVDNRPGAGGLLGGELASKAPPDGYTLILANISSHGVNPALYAKLPYDPIKDFAPIGRAGADLEHPDREFGAAVQDAQGHRRPRQGQSRQAVLRVAGAGLARSISRSSCCAPSPATST